MKFIQYFPKKNSLEWNNNDDKKENRPCFVLSREWRKAKKGNANTFFCWNSPFLFSHFDVWVYVWVFVSVVSVAYITIGGVFYLFFPEKGFQYLWFVLFCLFWFIFVKLFWFVKLYAILFHFNPFSFQRIVCHLVFWKVFFLCVMDYNCEKCCRRHFIFSAVKLRHSNFCY